MNIKAIKAGEKIVARRIDQNGRYEFGEFTIKRIVGANAIVIDQVLSFNRETGRETGPHVGTELRQWEAFPFETEEIAAQKALKERGELAPAWSPDVVRLHRALARMKYAPMHEIEKHDKLAAAVIAAFGKPDDWVAEVKQKI